VNHQYYVGQTPRRNIYAARCGAHAPAGGSMGMTHAACDVCEHEARGLASAGRLAAHASARARATESMVVVLLDALERAEMALSLAPDCRRIMRDERVALMATRTRRQATEAVRVMRMWGVA
jgi:hypothetical protein